MTTFSNNPHLDNIADHLRQLQIQPQTKIMLVSMPRTGSSYLCDSISKIHENTVGEQFELHWLDSYMQRHGLDIEQYCDEIIKGDIFIANVMLHQFRYYLKQGFDLRTKFNRFVYLYREDFDAMAKSRVIAEKTGFWESWSNAGWSAAKARQVNNIPEYKPELDEINIMKQNLIEHELSYLHYFRFDYYVKFEDIIDDTKLPQILLDITTGLR